MRPWQRIEKRILKRFRGGWPRRQKQDNSYSHHIIFYNEAAGKLVAFSPAFRALGLPGCNNDGIP